MISLDNQNNARKVSDCLSLTRSLFVLLTTTFLPRISLTFTYVITNKTLLILSLFVNDDRHIFPAKKRMCSERLRLLLQLFLKLQSFWYNNYNGYFFYLQSTMVKTILQNVLYQWSLVHIKVSSRCVWKLPLKEMAKANQNLITYVGSTFYKYLGGVVVKHYYIVNNDC